MAFILPTNISILNLRRFLSSQIHSELMLLCSHSQLLAEPVLNITFSSSKKHCLKTKYSTNPFFIILSTWENGNEHGCRFYSIYQHCKQSWLKRTGRSISYVASKTMPGSTLYYNAVLSNDQWIIGEIIFCV